MHSLVIMKNSGLYTEEELKKDICLQDGIWNISKENLIFNGGFDILETFEAKVRYAIAEFCADLTDSLDLLKESLRRFRKIEDIVKKYIPGCQGINLEKDTGIFYFDESGNPVSPTEKECAAEMKQMEIPCFGHIDYESNGLLTSFLANKKVSLEDFLIRKEYRVIVIWDSDDRWDEMKQIDEDCSGSIEEEYFFPDIDWPRHHVL